MCDNPLLCSLLLFGVLLLCRFCWVQRISVSGETSGQSSQRKPTPDGRRVSVGSLLAPLAVCRSFFTHRALFKHSYIQPSADALISMTHAYLFIFIAKPIFVMAFESELDNWGSSGIWTWDCHDAWNNTEATFLIWMQHLRLVRLINVLITFYALTIGSKTKCLRAINICSDLHLFFSWWKCVLSLKTQQYFNFVFVFPFCCVQIFI